MSALRKRLVIAALLSLAASAAGALFVGSALCAPCPSSVGNAPVELAAREVEFDSKSGSRIQGWWISGEVNQAAIVLAHSLRANRREMIGRACFLHAAGYSVLMYDAQAHGESYGEQLTFGVLEAHDARAAVAFAREQNSQVAFLGSSLGGAAALLHEVPLKVDALILEAVYPTLSEAAHNRIELRLGPLAYVLTPLLLLQVEPRLGIPLDSIAPLDEVARVEAPLLVVAGEVDRHTTLSQSKRMFEAAPEPKELWVVPNAAHVNLHAAYPALYERRILTFLARAGL